nr:Ger(x)C family spore germination protein [Paenibacillus phyllosphaerae]
MLRFIPLIQLLRTLLLAGMCVPLAGCWDMIEVSRSTLITGLAIDKDGKKNDIVTFEVLNTSEAQPHNQSGGAPTTLYTSEGDSVADLERLNEKLERQIVTSHNQIILIDEDIAREGLSQYIDILQRSRYVREDVTLLITHDVPASRLLKVVYPGNMYASLKIRSQVENYHERWGGVPISQLFNYTQATLTEGNSLILGAITATGDPQVSQNMDSVKSLVPKSTILITGSAVFREDKLIGFIGANDTRYVNMIRNQLSNTSFAVPIADGKSAAIRYKHWDTELSVVMNGDVPHVKIHLSGEGQIASILGDVPLDEVTGFQQVEQAADRYLADQVQATVNKIQTKFGVDVFGFGQHLYRHHYRQYLPFKKDWNSAFVRAKVDVTASVRITNSDLKTSRLKKEPS